MQIHLRWEKKETTVFTQTIEEVHRLLEDEFYEIESFTNRWSSFFKFYPYYTNAYIFAAMPGANTWFDI